MLKQHLTFEIEKCVVEKREDFKILRLTASRILDFNSKSDTCLIYFDFNLDDDVMRKTFATPSRMRAYRCRARAKVQRISINYRSGRDMCTQMDVVYQGYVLPAIVHQFCRRKSQGRSSWWARPAREYGLLQAEDASYPNVLGPPPLP